VRPQQLEVDPRLVVEALEVSLRNQADQVAIARLVLREQDQVVDAVDAARLRVPVEAGALRDVDLAADDRLDSGLLRLFVELHRAEQVAVVRARHRGHPGGLDVGHQLLDRNGAVEDRVLRVQVQMGEVRQLRQGPLRRRTRFVG
jgi:hypothetical protein